MFSLSRLFSGVPYIGPSGTSNSGAPSSSGSVPSDSRGGQPNPGGDLSSRELPPGVSHNDSWWSLQGYHEDGKYQPFISDENNDWFNQLFGHLA